MNDSLEVQNRGFRLWVETDAAGREIRARLHDPAMDFDVADGPVIYRATRPCDGGALTARGLTGHRISVDGERLTIIGNLADLTVEHVFHVPADRLIVEERIVLRNETDTVIDLGDLVVGLQRRIATEWGRVDEDVGQDRLVAVPLRHRASDPKEFDADFDFAWLLKHPGREQRVGEVEIRWPRYGYVPCLGWASEGWAWTHGAYTLGVFKFNQEAMEFSVVAPEPLDDRVALRFGGAATLGGDPAWLRNIAPEQTVTLGVTRYETVEGGYENACYRFRAFLDENGCRFPEDFNPPVHWNELYDNPECTLTTPGSPPEPHETRPVTYTRTLMEEEAEKAVAYGCEALYLDPGWDTAFGTFLWGEEWLGPRADFVRRIRDAYGLAVSLHCPLAPWLSVDRRGVSSWPKEACQMDRGGKVLEGRVCLGSRQYLDEAAQRLLACCADGVVYLMFDGNWWYGGCWNQDHGHPVPYTKEDHARAQLELCRRVHAKYPHVIVEMHDMITGGTPQRYTPVYYKYGLPGSYDENWGFELMRKPIEDILSGRARALYYYNLGCNVPVYLHIDLRDDNQHCLGLWWYASTCRHLGIGGTHPNPRIIEAQQQAMQTYRRLDRFYKRGEFHGLGEEIHLHVLPGENALVANLFNLSDASRVVEASVAVDQLGIEPDLFYDVTKGGRFNGRQGTFEIKRRLAPWSADLVEVRPVEGVPRGGG